MARLNIAARSAPVFTHEGGRARHLTAEQALRRSVMSCMLWEDEFYEDGKSIADRIAETAEKVAPHTLANIALEARNSMHLRHVPLLLLDTLSKTGKGHTFVADTVADVVQRPDEMGELLSILWRKGRKMVPWQVNRGLKRAFGKFDEYQLAKYDRDGAVKLRDVLRLVRPKPADESQSALWRRVKDRDLRVPDTWEVALSAGGDKRETFTRLLKEGKLGYLALLRNLRNMADAGVDRDLVNEAIIARKGGAHRVLPFRYVAAARAAPQFEPAIDKALLAAIGELPALPGTTAVLVDHSGSMDVPLSGKSDMKRIDAAAALASIIPGDVRVFAFSNDVREIPARRGMAGIDAICRLPMNGTYLGAAVANVNLIKHDRLICITDEQSADSVPDPVAKHAYMINVGSYKNGVGYGPHWVHIDGFSESVLRFINEYERIG